jgi:hypothetical protein
MDADCFQRNMSRQAPYHRRCTQGPRRVRCIAGHRRSRHGGVPLACCEKPATVGPHLDGRAFTRAGYLLTSWSPRPPRGATRHASSAATRGALAPAELVSQRRNPTS